MRVSEQNELTGETECGEERGDVTCPVPMSLTRPLSPCAPHPQACCPSGSENFRFRVGARAGVPVTSHSSAPRKLIFPSDSWLMCQKGP